MVTWKIGALLAARSRAQISASSWLLTAFVGAVDYMTGYELSFSIFYLIPIGLSSWYSGLRAGLPISVASAATWLLVDITSGHPHANLVIPLWNSGVRLGFFVIVANLLCRLHAALDVQTTFAQQDSLTGVLNVRTFKQRYEVLYRLSARQSRPMALGYLDVDGLKAVNDSLGHGVGDQVLQAVAATLTSRLRASDVVGRVGGDEFVILLSETDLAGARTFFTEMRDTLLARAGHSQWSIGFSMGVVVFSALPANADDALRLADELMYKVKSTTKNDVVFQELA